MDGLFFIGFGCIGVSDDAWDHLVFVGGASDHDDASLGFELVEDEVHDGFEELAVVHDPGGDGGEGVDDAEVVDGGVLGVEAVGGFGTDVGIARRDDAGFDFGFEIEVVGDEDGWFSSWLAWVAESEYGGPDADLVTFFESDAVFDGDAVDDGAVL